jgi:squalene cyclase
VGWDIDLKDKPAFLAAIRKLASMDYAEISDWSAHAWQYCNTFMRESDIKREYLKLFS